MSSDILLVGLGSMGVAYGAVLRELKVKVIAVGRSSKGVAEFTNACAITAHGGGLAAWAATADVVPKSAIVCVPIEETSSVVHLLLGLGVRRILVEKPGAATPAQISSLLADVKGSSAEVFVAYNRRFYASVLETQRRILAEGGVLSFQFEFTERERDALLPKFSSVVRQHWCLANSSHVIDLAFFLGGQPRRLNAERAGSLPWHSSASCFVGSGISEFGAPFSYSANWASGGRWSVELMTAESRLILRPLEQLFVQRRGSFEILPVELVDDLDCRFKPGLFRQAAAFVEGRDSERFVSLGEQAERASGSFATISGEGL